MFAECTKTSKGECLVSVLKLVKMSVCRMYWSQWRWMLAEFTKTNEDECFPIILKLVKVNVSWVYSNQ